MTKPLSILSGGLLPGCCPVVPSAAELAKPNSEGAAAKVKKDEAEAKARAAAVRYLGTVDCHWWPDAEVALINALRADKNECVRYEAALALGRGCCCTKAIIKSLTICINQSEEDGNPSENSGRVRMAAEVALTQCLASAPAVSVPVEGGEKPPETPPEKPPEKTAQQGDGGEEHLRLTSYYVKQQSRPKSQVIEEARRALEKATVIQTQSTTVPTGHRNLADLWERAAAGSEGRETLPAAPPMPVVQDMSKEVVPAAHTEKYGGLLPALFRNADEAPKVTPTAPPAPPMGVAPKEVVPAEHTEKYGGLLPTHIRNTDEAPKVTPTAPSAPPMGVASKEVVPAEHTEKYGGLLPALFRHTDETPKPMPAAPTAPPMRVTSKEVDSADHTERHGGILPALFRDTNERPKPEVGWRPATVTIETPPEPVTQVARAPMKEPGRTAASPPVVSDADWLSVPKLLGVLKESRTSSQREWAAECLCGADCRSNPMVLPALMTAARTDVSPTVRIACIHTLVKLHATGSEVLGTLHALSTDKDVNVQREASQALMQMGVKKPASGIQQVGGTTPAR
jgi:hypothetical protein